MSEIFVAKNFKFFENYDVPTRTKGRGLKQCGNFSKKDGGQFLCDFVGTIVITPSAIKTAL